MYFVLRNTEDGLSIRGYSRTALNEYIAEETSEDIRPECRLEFQTAIPDEYTGTRQACIIEGEVIMPRKTYNV